MKAKAVNRSSAPAKPPRPRLKEVARVAGVHVSTVSRALNDKTSHLITAEVRARIREVCDRLGYVPNQTAYSLRTNRTRTVGVVIPDITNPVFPPIIRGIEDGLFEHGYVAITVNTDGHEAREKLMIETLLARSVDGLIMANVLHADASISKLARHSVEVVTVNRRVDDPAVPSVVNREDEGIRMMLSHLARLGHRRIAHIAGPQNASTGRHRFECFSAALCEHGLAAATCPTVFAGAFNEAEGERCARALMADRTGVTAILCANDRIAVGAIAELRRHGLDCPRDMSVTGFNDMPFADRIDPPLTTIRVAQYAAGKSAATIMVERLTSATPVEPRHELMPVELVVRASSAPPPAG
jgi:LacI family transcriptional regulator